jgi:serine/threonine-protein kinase
MSGETVATSDCPPDDAFVDLLDGRLAELDAARVRRHAEGCSTCEALLAELTKSATVHARTDDQIARELFRGPAASSAQRTLDQKYALLRLLGRGGMGEVYEAEIVGTGRRVAVKLIHARLIERGVEAESRFRREARAAGATHSAHIVEVLDSGEDKETGDLYLVMEHLRGEDLQHLIAHAGPLLPDVALRIAAQALVGIAAAHDAGIVHRDIKPANLFLVRGEGGEVTVKLLDFGIAKVTHGPLKAALTAGLTRTDGLLGSPLFMSPEQMQSSKGVDERTDLWSLGSVLYAALTGRAPFAHIENVFELLPAIRAEAAPPLRDLAPWVSPETAAAVQRALAVDPDRRYPSAAVMLEEIQALLPGGSALRDEMLTGVSPEALALVAVPSPPARHGADPVSGAESTLALDGRAGGPRPWSARARLAVLAAVLLGAVVVRVTRAPVPAPSASTTPVATASASPTVPLTATPPPPAPEPVRRVTLRIVPDDASVEVDGFLARADTRSGTVEVAGLPGSVHHVRVSKGRDEIRADVVVTDQGAVPPKVELSPRLPARKPSSTMGAPPGPAPSSAPQSSSTMTASSSAPATSPAASAGANDPMREHL